MKEMRKYVGLEQLRRIVIAIPYAWLLLFFLVPFFLVIIISFSEAAESVPPYDSCIRLLKNEGALLIKPYFDNFQQIFSDFLFLKTYLDSLYIALIATIITLLIAYPMAYGITLLPPRYRNLALLFVIIPFWTSMLIRIYSWMVLLKYNGIINNFLLWAGIINHPLEMLDNYAAVILGIVYSYLPFMLLPIYSSLEKIDPILLEAAADLGYKPFRRFIHITLPLSLPGVISGTLLVFIPATGEFMIPELMGGSSVMTIGKLIWHEFFMNRDWPMAAAITVILTFLLVIPIAFVQKFIAKKEV